MTERKTIRSRKKKGHTVEAVIAGKTTEITVIARRGAVLYGVGLTPRHAIVFVRLVETLGAPEVDDYTSITFNELQREERVIKNNVQVTVSCFVSNAHLDEKYPDLKKRLEAKVYQLIKQIPKEEVFEF